MMKIMILYTLLFLGGCLLTNTSYAQMGTDLILTGDNSWIFHTPDDGRTNLYIAPKTHGVWDWGLFYLQADGTFNTIKVNTQKLIVNQALGIGVSSPQEKLEVNGKIRAHEIKVETAHWPDYVFQEDYDLKSLQEINQFIQVNGHLPEIPKASEAEENGVSLGEMNKLLLKKIEELTLHLIEKDRQILVQNEKMKVIEQRLDQLYQTSHSK